jgi:hypothetical protein
MAVIHVVRVLGPVVHGTLSSCQAQLADENNQSASNRHYDSINKHTVYMGIKTQTGLTTYDIHNINYPCNFYYTYRESCEWERLIRFSILDESNSCGLSSYPHRVGLYYSLA